MLHRMATKNPRISVTLTPELSSILDRLSGLTGDSKSAMVAELLSQSAPVFERMIVALDAAQVLKDQAGVGMSEIGLGLKRAQERVEAQLGLALDELDSGFLPILEQAEKVSRRARRGGGMPRTRRAGLGATTPVPVTRGSGTLRGGDQEEVKPGRRKLKGG